MANEIRFTPSIVYENGTLKRQFAPGTINMPQASKGVYNNCIAATTAEADVAIGSIGTPGIAVLHNLESTTTGKTWNYGLKSSTGGIPQYFRLPPKQMAFVNYGTSAMIIRGKAASGTLQVDVIIFES